MASVRIIYNMQTLFCLIGPEMICLHLWWYQEPLSASHLKCQPIACFLLRQQPRLFSSLGPLYRLTTALSLNITQENVILNINTIGYVLDLYVYFLSLNYNEALGEEGSCLPWSVLPFCFHRLEYHPCIRSTELMDVEHAIYKWIYKIHRWATTIVSHLMLIKKKIYFMQIWSLRLIMNTELSKL